MVISAPLLNAHKALCAIGGRIARTRPRENLTLRRLLIRPGAIGDFIVSLPALESLRGDYTEVWCAGSNVPLARFANSARSIASAGLDRLGLMPAEDVIARLQSFDSIISWYGANRQDFRQFVHDLGLPFQLLAALPSGGIHAVDFYNQQAQRLGARPRSRFPRIQCPARTRSFAAIHPFASSAAKRAPIEIFEQLAARLSEWMPVQWFCGPEEELEGTLRIPGLYDLACCLSEARIFVGNDSGISHLAAAVGTPVLSFFRAGDARVWSARGPAVDIIAI